MRTDWNMLMKGCVSPVYRWTLLVPGKNLNVGKLSKSWNEQKISWESNTYRFWSEKSRVKRPIRTGAIEQLLALISSADWVVLHVYKVVGHVMWPLLMRSQWGYMLVKRFYLTAWCGRVITWFHVMLSACYLSHQRRWSSHFVRVLHETIWKKEG